MARVIALNLSAAFYLAHGRRLISIRAVVVVTAVKRVLLYSVAAAGDTVVTSAHLETAATTMVCCDSRCVTRMLFLRRSYADFVLLVKIFTAGSFICCA